MPDRLAHPGRAVRVDAEVPDLILFVHDRAVAYRAMTRHPELRRARMALLRDMDDIRDHVAGALEQHRVALADVLAANLVEIVERRVGNRHAGERDRLELRDRRQRADSAHRHDDLFDPRFGLLGLELVRDRPSRRSRNLAELLLERERVDLGDHAVGLVVELMAPLGHFVPELQHALHAGAHSR